MITVIDIPSPHVLRTPEEYENAVAEIDRLLEIDPEPFTRDYDRLELLTVLVESYEA
jgi:antitoxin component HigA of HigAB toxin-antitoxin module